MNSLVFEAEVIPAHWILQRVIFMAIKFHCYDATSMFLEVLKSWDFHAASK